MFKYVNEQSNEIEELEIGIAELKDELKEYYLTVSNPATIKEKHLLDLEEKLSWGQTRLEDCEERYKRTSRMLKNLTTQVETIFTTL